MLGCRHSTGPNACNPLKCRDPLSVWNSVSAASTEEILHILVVDDNAAIHDDFRKILLPGNDEPGRLDQLENALFGDEPPTRRGRFLPHQAFTLHSAYGGEQAIAMVRDATRQGRHFCVAFVDVRMPPGINGIETIPHLWQADPNLQIVICTAYSDHTWSDIVRSFGYRDSLLVLRKPFDSIEALQVAHALARKWTLGRQVKLRMEALEHAVQARTADLERTNRELSEQVARCNAAEHELRKLATHDTLTEVPNRVLLRERLQSALARAKRQQGLAALLLLDLDHFKDLNDTYGHQAGDQVLREFSERLRTCVRISDTVARMGGDEFAILLEDIAEPEEAAIIAERVLRVCADPFDVLGNAVHVPPSIGIAVYPNDCSDVESLVQSADVAMYEAKENGRATYRYFSHQMLESSQEKLMIREQLLQAVELGQLRVYYQPLLDARTGHVSTMEALVRWEHPSLGLIPPIKFIPAAEKSGLIVPIGAWVLRTACQQLAQWRALGACNLSMAVNVSARELQSLGFVDTVQGVLSETDLDPGLLELELTESTALRDPELSVQVLSELARHGVRLAIDDFGSGHSSLMRLRSIPISVLKIDRFFVRDIVSSSRDRAIVTAVISMAHTLGLVVVAEGVETNEQLTALRDLRCDGSDTSCDRYQGYLLSRPLPADKATAFLVDDLERQHPQVKAAL